MFGFQSMVDGPMELNLMYPDDDDDDDDLQFGESFTVQLQHAPATNDTHRPSDVVQLQRTPATNDTHSLAVK